MTLNFYKTLQHSLLVLISLVLFYACNSNQPKAINTSSAPKAIGPYSQAVKYGNMVYCSGQIGIIPATGALAGTDISSQANQALKNLSAVLEEAGSNMSNVVKVTVYLKDLNDYAVVNDIYKIYFPGLKPARAAIQVSRLPKDALIEIECIGVQADK